MRKSKEFKEQATKAIAGVFAFLKLILRQLRSIRLNRNFLVFLIFLGISTSLWFMQTYQETLTSTLQYKVKLVGIPKNYIMTSQVPDQISVVVSAHGSAFYRFLFSKNEHEIEVEFDDIDCTSSSMTVSNSILKRNITRNLGSEFRVVSVNPSQLVLYYTMGKAHKLPIEFVGHLTAGRQRIISKVTISPDSASVYLPLSLTDSVKVIRTQARNLSNVVEPTSFRVALQKMDKMIIAPDSVDVTLSVDLQTETHLTVPVYSLNCPRNKIIRTFPGKVDVKFRTTASALNKAKPDDFLLAVDFSKIKGTEKYSKVELIAKPDYATNVQYSPQQVQFVIEDEVNF